MELGYLVVLKKGKVRGPYVLDEGAHRIGRSMHCNIRLKIHNPLFLDTHAIIRVLENGAAIMFNKSTGAPVKVNEKNALKPTILKHEDKFEIFDKHFQYFNEKLKHEPEDSQIYVQAMRHILQGRRRTVHPLIKNPTESTTYKTKAGLSTEGLLNKSWSTSLKKSLNKNSHTETRRSLASSIQTRTLASTTASRLSHTPSQMKKEKLLLKEEILTPIPLSRAPKTNSRLSQKQSEVSDQIELNESNSKKRQSLNRSTTSGETRRSLDSSIQTRTLASMTASRLSQTPSQMKKKKLLLKEEILTPIPLSTAPKTNSRLSQKQSEVSDQIELNESNTKKRQSLNRSTTSGETRLSLDSSIQTRTVASTTASRLSQTPSQIKKEIKEEILSPIPLSSVHYEISDQIELNESNTMKRQSLNRLTTSRSNSISANSYLDEVSASSEDINGSQARFSSADVNPNLTDAEKFLLPKSFDANESKISLNQTKPSTSNQTRQSMLLNNASGNYSRLSSKPTSNRKSKISFNQSRPMSRQTMLSMYGSHSSSRLDKSDNTEFETASSTSIQHNESSPTTLVKENVSEVEEDTSSTLYSFSLSSSYSSQLLSSSLDDDEIPATQVDESTEKRLSKNFSAVSVSCTDSAISGSPNVSSKTSRSTPNKHSIITINSDSNCDDNSVAASRSLTRSKSRAEISVKGEPPSYSSDINSRAEISVKGEPPSYSSDINSPQALTVQNSRETTVEVHQTSTKNLDFSRSRRSKRISSTFDESTRVNNFNGLDNKSLLRQSTFDDSTQEVWPILNAKKSLEVLSPVQPSSLRTSLRLFKKEQKSENSSLTMTSVEHSTGSAMSISSQSFSSFKKARHGDKLEESEIIEVVNITVESTDALESTRPARTPEERLTKRQSLPSQMFDDVSCTSTPFHKPPTNKKTEKADSSENAANSMTRSKSQYSRKSENGSDALVTKSPQVTRSQSTSSSVAEVILPKRRSSSRSSVSRNGEHNCVSCRHSSVIRSRSLSASSHTPAANNLQNASVTASLSTGDAVSPAKRTSTSIKAETPLLHRVSVISLPTENTPKKSTSTEDETPKSHVKTTRRSSEANRSTYIPDVEDITPVTPDKLQVSGFTEEVFKTPVNTPGLFESIRKSVIRSRKRHRETIGSAVIDVKRARVDFNQEEDKSKAPALETSPVIEKRKQRSPLNRLSNFEGVKKLLKTPQKSPKNDLRNVINLRRIMSPKQQNSPKNDLTNPIGVKKLLRSPKNQKLPVDDLTDVSGVANIFNVSKERKQRSPLNRLSNFEGVKKLLKTPQKSPKNDLRNVINLRRIMSPKQQNNPKNDLTNPIGVKKLLRSPKNQKFPVDDLTDVSGVANMFNVSKERKQRSPLNRLSNFEGVKKLLKTPQKSPKNDLRNVINLRRIMSPKQQNSPKNDLTNPIGVRKLMKSPNIQKLPVDDLTNVSGVAKMFNVSEVETLHHGSDIENSEDLFTQLTGKKAVKAYSRGKSLSPNKAKSLEEGTTRKTMGDIPVCSPRVQQWVEDHAAYVNAEKPTYIEESVFENMLENPQRVQTSDNEGISFEKSMKNDRTSGNFLEVPSNDDLRTFENALPVKTRKASNLREKIKAETVNRKETSEEEEETGNKRELRKRPKRGEATQEVKMNNKPLEVLKRGAGRKRVLSEDDINIPIKTTRARRGEQISELPLEKEVAQPRTRSRRGNTQLEHLAVAASSARGKRTKAAPVETNEEVILIDETTTKSPVKRGGRKRKQNQKPENSEDNEVFEDKKDVPDKPESVTKKAATTRSRKAKKDSMGDTAEEDTKTENEGRPRRIVVYEDDEVVMTQHEHLAVAASSARGKRTKAAPVETNEEVVFIDETTTKSPVKRGARKTKQNQKPESSEDNEVFGEKKDVPDKPESVTKKAANTRSRKAKKDSMGDIAEEDTKKENEGRPRRIVVYEDDEVVMTQHEHLAVAASSARGKRTKAAPVETNEEVVFIDETTTKSPVKRGARKTKQNQKPESSEDNEVFGEKKDVPDKPESVTKKAANTRSRKAKKDSMGDIAEEDTKTENEGRPRRIVVYEDDEVVMTQHEHLAVAASSARGKRTKAAPVETNEEVILIDETTTTSPVKRGGRKRKQNQKPENSEDNEVFEDKKDVPDKPESVTKKAANTRSRKANKDSMGDIVEEDATKENEGRSRRIVVYEDDEVVMTQRLRNRRKKPANEKPAVVAEVEPPKNIATRSKDKKNEKQPAKPKNKIIEEVIEIDLDSPRATRAKRGANKKYPADDYEFPKRKVHFDDVNEKQTHEVPAKRTRRARK